MSGRVHLLDRVVLTLLGLLLLAAGGLGLALGMEAFGRSRASDQVLPQEVVDYPDGRQWFWWAVTGALLLIAVLALLWLLSQLKTDRMTRLDLTTNARDGYTTLHARALTDAVENEALGVRGVTRASAKVREHRERHLFLLVELADSANIDGVRTELENEVVAHLREGVGDPHLPVTIELRPSASRTRQRALA
ncbi:alkaline shock response membrane anchor protein AmaP [Nocardioides sp. CER19]|uniref:alkaline shock response membrane anchor protein AmaP n=1 Tax=Nocardioides sp. CER19 TaxID=3038538 RepID=UPI00244BD728|nr:alkaline shock response membrane anchor protein AmaP [Nocardioides sp. CER19]MDH2413791.1 alkaline shock response membrane anchor protein AmaP [Nocardioides sp. CER19]